MTTHAVTSMAIHTPLEDLGYKTCNKKRTGHTGYRWMGRETCPKCNPPQKVVLENSIRPEKSSRKIPASVTRTNQRDRKLTREQVIEVRRLYHVEGWTDSQLSKRFGLNASSLHKIAIGKSYRDVDMPSPEVVEARAALRKKLTSRTHCKHGHEIAKVGRNSNGGCKECMRIFNKNRYREQVGLA